MYALTNTHGIVYYKTRQAQKIFLTGLYFLALIINLEKLYIKCQTHYPSKLYVSNRKDRTA